MNKNQLIVVVVVAAILILGGLLFFISRKKPSNTSVTPTPAPMAEAPQLPESEQPRVSLQFSADAHYVTVNISNIRSDQLEYNLIYDATVKGNKIQTGVNASTKMDGATTYSGRQLLGSESSGKFTYHQDIKNAVMELSLRDSLNRSVFTGTYPFTVTAGASVEPTLQ